MKNKALKIFLSIVYLFYVYLMISGKIPWNLWTLYVALLAAWFLVCSWLPFNAKSYQTSFSFKLIFAAIQALLVFIFTGAAWQVFNLPQLFVKKTQSVPYASAPATQTAPVNPLQEEDVLSNTSQTTTLAPSAATTEEAETPLREEKVLFPQDTTSPANISADGGLPPDFMPPSAQLYVPLGTERETSLLEELKKQREKASASNATEYKAISPIPANNTAEQMPPAPAAQTYGEEQNPKMQDPAYRQAATEVQAEIIKQDAKAIQSIFSQQEMASVNKMIPFSRYPLIKVLIQKHINFTKANIEEAQKQGFPQKEIDFLRQKLNKLETTKQDFLKRHSKEYQQQAINQRLTQLKQKAQ